MKIISLVSLVIGASSQLASLDTCRNPMYDLIFRRLDGSPREQQEWISNEKPMHCDFMDCPALFKRKIFSSNTLL